MALRTPMVLATLSLACLVAARSASPAGSADPPASITVRPADVPVGVFYHGTRLDVDATVATSDQIAVVCTGQDGEVTLTSKGRVLGLLWMNTGETTLSHVPALYQLSTQRSLCDLARPAVRRELGVGYDAVEARVVGDRDPGEEGRVFEEFVKLKEREGLYSERENSVQRAELDGGLTRVSTTFWLPARAHFGSYQVAVYGFRDGVGSRLGVADVTVRPVGLVAFMFHQAARHGLLYGILAVGVAIVTGLLTGVVFGRGPGKAH